MVGIMYAAPPVPAASGDGPRIIPGRLWDVLTAAQQISLNLGLTLARVRGGAEAAYPASNAEAPTNLDDLAKLIHDVQRITLEQIQELGEYV